MNRKKVLICPLNWGLGHASRDIPIIQNLLKNELNVVIGAYGDSLKYLQQEFPEIQCINLPGYAVRYSGSGSQVFKMAILSLKILWWSIKEHRYLKEIVACHKIDIIISDNRFGLWNKNTYNVFITHQLKVRFPRGLRFLEPLYQIVSKRFINQFDECWIPDYNGSENLSGELSHGNFNLNNSCYIGPLSRFVNIEYKECKPEIDVLFILSGPEPQRSIFEDIIYKQTKNAGGKFALVRGSLKPRKNEFKFPVYGLLGTKELVQLIIKSKLIVCRPGYSSIMDLVAVKKKAVLVPTPGQTEQEYLAERLLQGKYFYASPQQGFNLESAIEKAVEFPQVQFTEKRLLENRIKVLKK